MRCWLFWDSLLRTNANSNANANTNTHTRTHTGLTLPSWPWSTSSTAAPTCCCPGPGSYTSRRRRLAAPCRGQGQAGRQRSLAFTPSMHTSTHTYIHTYIQPNGNRNSAFEGLGETPVWRLQRDCSKEEGAGEGGACCATHTAALVEATHGGHDVDGDGSIGGWSALTTKMDLGA